MHNNGPFNEPDDFGIHGLIFHAKAIKFWRYSRLLCSTQTVLDLTSPNILLHPSPGFLSWLQFPLFPWCGAFSGLGSCGVCHPQMSIFCHFNIRLFVVVRKCCGGLPRGSNTMSIVCLSTYVMQTGYQTIHHNHHRPVIVHKSKIKLLTMIIFLLKYQFYQSGINRESSKTKWCSPRI